MTTDKTETQLSLQQLSRIDIPAKMMADLNIEHILQKVKEAFADIDAVGKNVAEISNAGFLIKFFYGVTGKTTKTLAEAIRVQGELAKFQMALMTLNLFLAKELNKQQQELMRQGEEILAQNRELQKQHAELKELTKKSIQQQETILKLNKLTEDQEKAIRDLLDKAEKLREIEEKYSARLEELNLNFNKGMENLAGEVEKQSQAAEGQKELLKSHGVGLEKLNEISVENKNAINTEKGKRKDVVSWLKKLTIAFILLAAIVGVGFAVVFLKGK